MQCVLFKFGLLSTKWKQKQLSQKHPGPVAATMEEVLPCPRMLFSANSCRWQQSCELWANLGSCSLHVEKGRTKVLRAGKGRERERVFGFYGPRSMQHALSPHNLPGIAALSLCCISLFCLMQAFSSLVRMYFYHKQQRPSASCPWASVFNLVCIFKAFAVTLCLNSTSQEDIPSTQPQFAQVFIRSW